MLPHCLANAPIPILLNAHIHLFNAKCELELAEDHDKMVVDLCSKHGQSRDELEEKIDSLQKANAKLEQEKASLSTENADLVRQVHKLEKDASLKGKHREGAAVASIGHPSRHFPPGGDLEKEIQELMRQLAQLQQETECKLADKDTMIEGLR